MGWFEGFPFVSKEERERRSKEFASRLVPFGIDEQREYTAKTLKELFPDHDTKDCLFTFFDAKDFYTKKDKGAPGLAAARVRLQRQKWIDERKTKIFLAFIELESEIESLDDYPTAEQVMDHAFPDEVL